MRILLIEDEFKLAEALTASLKKENYMVDIVNEGNAGLQQALTGIYDVIILDIMLPNMDGFQILSKLRQGKIDTPILILSAKSELDDKVRGLDGGADDYLTKPFQTKELLARVRVLSRRRGQLSDDKITFSNLELDIKKCEVRCTLTNESVSLGAKEFQLIKYLLSNSNQIISREQIVEKIWGVDNEAEYNNVEVYISFIRKKIAFIGASVKIRAVRGIGYTLEE